MQLASERQLSQFMQFIYLEDHITEESMVRETPIRLPPVDKIQYLDDVDPSPSPSTSYLENSFDLDLDRTPAHSSTGHTYHIEHDILIAPNDGIPIKYTICYLALTLALPLSCTSCFIILILDESPAIDNLQTVMIDLKMSPTEKTTKRLGSNVDKKENVPNTNANTVAKSANVKESPIYCIEKEQNLVY